VQKKSLKKPVYRMTGNKILKLRERFDEEDRG